MDTTQFNYISLTVQDAVKNLLDAGLETQAALSRGYDLALTLAGIGNEVLASSVIRNVAKELHIDRNSQEASSSQIARKLERKA